MRRLAPHSRQSASPVRVPGATSGLSFQLQAPMNGSLHGPLLRRPRPRSRRKRRRPPGDHEPTTNLTTLSEDFHSTTRPTLNAAAPCALLSLLASCSALLRVPAGSFEKGGVPQFQRLAPPYLSLRPASSSCGKLRERRRYPFPAPHSSYPSIASEPPRPSRHTNRGEKRPEKPVHHRSSFLFFTPAFSDPFRRGKGCSVVCGGWCLKADVVAKMVKWWLLLGRL